MALSICTIRYHLDVALKGSMIRPLVDEIYAEEVQDQTAKDVVCKCSANGQHIGEGE